jgi:hypothetical protein
MRGPAMWRHLAAVVFVIVVVVSVLWVGGPFGVTQALGEYLRPTTVELVALRGCVETQETPPAKLMRLVENQKVVYRSALELQKVVVCRDPSRPPQAERRFLAPKGWVPPYVGGSYSYRRHVIVVVADSDERGSVIVEAALIQGRWDYLRLNWYKMRPYWSWPHAGR